jgi:hypothetical protein
MRISPIPMEWMDPMSWRLPSGKALAEFWLQAGFLAPLMLRTPVVKHKKVQTVTPIVASKNVEEAQERSATFRAARDLGETRDFREASDIREARDFR